MFQLPVPILGFALASELFVWLEFGRGGWPPAALASEVSEPCLGVGQASERLEKLLAPIEVVTRSVRRSVGSSLDR